MSVDNYIHVLHIASGDLWAGAEMQLCTLAKAQLRMTGIRVSVVVLNHGRLEQELLNCGIDVDVLDEYRMGGFAILSHLVRMLRAKQPDIIHTHRTKENVLGSLAAILTYGIASVRTAHGAPEHRPPLVQLHKQAYRFMDWFCGRYLQKKVIAVSRDLAGILMRSYPSSKVSTILNGIDTVTLIEAANKSSPATRKEDDVFRIGLAGRLVPVKRVDIFIHTALELQKRKPGMKASFHIYGEGPLLSSLQSLSRALRTTDIVHFEGHRDDMPAQLARLDILLMPSDHEGLPMTLLEAMTLKVPVIAHAAGGIPDLLQQGDCGLLVHDHTPSGYADAVSTLYDNVALRAKLVENAIRQVMSQHTAEHNAAETVALYRSVLQV